MSTDAFVDVWLKEICYNSYCHFHLEWGEVEEGGEGRGYMLTSMGAMRGFT